MPEAQGTDFLTAGEWAAFHGRPGSGLTALHHALHDRAAGPRDLDKARWLLGVCLGAGGRYGEAVTTLRPLAAAPGRGDRWASFAASTTGSLHRQLGRYAAARDFDRAALTAARSLPDDDVEPIADALLGLAADAVGEGEVAAAREAHAEAARIAEAPDAPWRPRVRAAWVAAEIALLSDDGGAALSAADDAVKGAEDARAPRHHAKSLVFRAVALRVTGDLAGRRARRPPRPRAGRRARRPAGDLARRHRPPGHPHRGPGHRALPARGRPRRRGGPPRRRPTSSPGCPRTSPRPGSPGPASPTRTPTARRTRTRRTRPDRRPRPRGWPRVRIPDRKGRTSTPSVPTSADEPREPSGDPYADHCVWWWWSCWSSSCSSARSSSTASRRSTSSSGSATRSSRPGRRSTSSSRGVTT